MRTSFPLSLAAAFLLLGCTVDFEQYRPGEGAGGTPAGGAGAGGVGGVGGTGATGAGASGAGGAGAGGMGGTGGTGGGPVCDDPLDCPAGVCENPTCTEGACGVTQKAEGDPCMTTNVCTAGGACVECVGQTQCTLPATCVNNQCASPVCQNGMLDAGETDTDCGGTTCPKCLVDDTCIVGSDCLTEFCDAGICQECGDSGDCDPTSYCDSSGALDTCLPDLVQGAACGNDDSRCPGDFCEDGFCCDMNCDDGCESCDSNESIGANGVCSPIDAGTDPEGDCDGTGCFTSNCSGTAGLCGYDPQGTDCGPESCNGANMLTVSVCDMTGTCTMPQALCPNNFACANSTSCRTTCSSDTHCQTDFFCIGQACIKKPDGAVCGDNDECANSFCVDSRCCNSVCNLTCQACDIGGSPGICTDITSMDPDMECPAGGDDGNNCAPGNTCN